MNLKFLKKNDVADVVFLGTAGTLDEVKKIKNFVKEIGLTPNIFLEKETTLKKSVNHEFASFKASQRFEQFKKAVESDSKIIWCARGGTSLYATSAMAEASPARGARVAVAQPLKLTAPLKVWSTTCPGEPLFL